MFKDLKRNIHLHPALPLDEHRFNRGKSYTNLWLKEPTRSVHSLWLAG
jgi:hypothetical protein